jgi:hypothetical protein
LWFTPCHKEIFLITKWKKILRILITPFFLAFILGFFFIFKKLRQDPDKGGTRASKDLFSSIISLLM